MGAGYHGGFGQTNKSYSKEINSSEPYKETATLRDHIVNPDISGSGKFGIKGGHNKENFMSAIEEVGAKVVKTQQNTHMDGVEKISYKMPKKDRFGNRTFEFQSSTKTKTVYDPSIITTDRYIKLGIEAANDAAQKNSSGKLGHEWSGTDSKGNKWHGYCDNSGNITSFYPED